MAQPFYCVLPVIFTTTRDVTDEMNSPEFKQKLERFLRKNLGSVLTGSVEYDGVADAVAGDPQDLA